MVPRIIIVFVAASNYLDTGLGFSPITNLKSSSSHLQIGIGRTALITSLSLKHAVLSSF